MPSTDRPSLSYARRDLAERRIAEARQRAQDIEEILVDVAKEIGKGMEPSSPLDPYALRIAQGLVRSLIDQLEVRPNSASRLIRESVREAELHEVEGEKDGPTRTTHVA